MDNISIVFPAGAFGANEYDSYLDSMLRCVAEEAKQDPNEWAEKYGTNFENDVFMMHPFCWCEKDTCPWCCGCTCDDKKCSYCISFGKEGSIPGKGAPNFWHKRSGFRVWWYKYIGRSTTIYCEKEIDLGSIYKDCMDSLCKK